MCIRDRDTTMQLEGVQQELAQQQQQAAEQISSLNKRLESKEQAHSSAVEIAVKQEREAFEAANVMHTKAEKELMLLRVKVAELEDTMMAKAEEGMTAMSSIDNLEASIKAANHTVNVTKAELAMRVKELQTSVETVGSLRTAKLGLEEKVNQLEQQLTFITQERDELASQKLELSEAEKDVSDQLKESDESHLMQIRQLNQKIEGLREELSAKEQQRASAVVLREQLQEELDSEHRAVQESFAQMEELRGQNGQLEARVAAFDKQLEDQHTQHKLNEKKNLKSIRELKSELLKAVEQKKVVEAEYRAHLEAAPEVPEPRQRSSTVDSGMSAPVQSLGSELQFQTEIPDSLADVNFRLETQLEEAQEELRRKEEMLQHYLKTAPAKGLTSMESDLVMMQTEMQHEEIKCSAGGLWGMFGGAPKTPMVSGEVHGKLKLVLEETLLENIRLKEDVDAMGEEVARLAK
eukprot:TRINITY_DN16692_c0_g1_i1.p1 TRINITY_DN16692_c0_g1~~TRINITY_DN16692_c0_g1_i1.p1  ORF type:complete len:465 (-),score=198.85 TRINITY_DN16692_c0_g1_i1:146-1540(-)